jgi:glucose-1-phosphate cytidylyltransferase
MKVVLFCGGQGMRLRDYSQQLPKPLVEVGPRPILWHLMRYYAHFGHKEFILCLGHGAKEIKDYFLKFDERLANDFVLQPGTHEVELLGREMDDWRITFVDTGLQSPIGERLRRVRHHLAGEELFLANYADGLSDLPLDQHVARFRRSGKTASFISVPAPHTFHIVHTDGEQFVTRLEHVTQSPVRINAGFFVLHQRIFEALAPGDELVTDAFEKLIPRREVICHPYDGFWRNMDTFKDKVALDELLARGEAPWQVWSKGPRD